MYWSLFHPYNRNFMSKLCRKCAPTGTQCDALCILISFGKQEKIGGKNRFGGDGMSPDLLMEAAARKDTMHTQVLKFCCVRPTFQRTYYLHESETVNIILAV